MRVVQLIVAGFLALGAAACGDDGGSSTSSSAASSTSTALVTAATTTSTVTTTTAATVAPTTEEPTTTAVACTPPSSTTERTGGGFPNGLSRLVGADARAGIHPCFERFVIEFGGTGALPGWWVRYVPLPVKADPSDLPVDLPGAGAAIVVTVQTWMPDPFGNVGYPGPGTVPVAGFRTFKVIKQIGNFEGTTSWAIGIDRQRGFSTMVLANPPRLVVDVAVG